MKKSAKKPGLRKLSQILEEENPVVIEITTRHTTGFIKDPKDQTSEHDWIGTFEEAKRFKRYEEAVTYILVMEGSLDCNPMSNRSWRFRYVKDIERELESEKYRIQRQRTSALAQFHNLTGRLTERLGLVSEGKFQGSDDGILNYSRTWVRGNISINISLMGTKDKTIGMTLSVDVLMQSGNVSTVVPHFVVMDVETIVDSEIDRASQIFNKLLDQAVTKAKKPFFIS